MTERGTTAAFDQLTDEQLVVRPFDELVVELQRVVQALEAGSVGLEESIELYKLGLRLHAACEDRLRRAELTITELGRRGAGGGAADATAPGE
jgi:exodeoxyribonuclease VII small subunit